MPQVKASRAAQHAPARTRARGRGAARNTARPCSPPWRTAARRRRRTVPARAPCAHGHTARAVFSTGWPGARIAQLAHSSAPKTKRMDAAGRRPAQAWRVIRTRHGWAACSRPAAAARTSAAHRKSRNTLAPQPAYRSRRHRRHGCTPLRRRCHQRLPRAASPSQRGVLTRTAGERHNDRRRRRRAAPAGARDAPPSPRRAGPSRRCPLPIRAKPSWRGIPAPVGR